MCGDEHGGESERERENGMRELDELEGLEEAPDHVGSRTFRRRSHDDGGGHT